MAEEKASCPPAPPPPDAGSAHVVRNGLTHSGTPGFRCRGCDRRFVAAPKTGPVPEATQDRVHRLLAEWFGIRATGRSRSWVQPFVNALYREHTPHDLGPPPKRPDRW